MLTPRTSLWIVSPYRLADAKLQLLVYLHPLEISKEEIDTHVAPN